MPNTLHKPSDTLKKLMLVIFVLGIVALAVGRIITKNKVSWGLGVSIGTLLSLIKVFMLEMALNKAVDMEKSAAENYVRASYTSRLILSVVIVAVCAVTKLISVPGVILGLLLVQPSAYITGIISKKEEAKS